MQNADCCSQSNRHWQVCCNVSSSFSLLLCEWTCLVSLVLTSFSASSRPLPPSSAFRSPIYGETSLSPIPSHPFLFALVPSFFHHLFFVPSFLVFPVSVSCSSPVVLYPRHPPPTRFLFLWCVCVCVYVLVGMVNLIFWSDI